MKKNLFVLLLLITLGAAYAQDGYTIMEALDSKAAPDTEHALLQMILIDQKEQQNERVVEQWSAVDNEGNTHSVMVFHSPASVKNTRFLTRENTDNDDDQWIFLPSLNRIRRIAASDGSSSFMGTEFTYDDLSSKKLDDSTYQYLRTENAQGYECYVVEARPRDGVDSNYFKTISWVTTDSEINTVVKIEMYKSETKLQKVLVVDDLKMVSGYWIPIRMTITNIENNRSTTILQQRLELDISVNPSRFTPRFLETGRTN